MRAFAILAPLLAATVLAAPKHHKHGYDYSDDDWEWEYYPYPSESSCPTPTGIGAGAPTGAVPDDFDYDKAVSFAIQADGCNPFSCLSILTKIPCIAAAVASGNIAAVVACVGNPKDLCPCVSCIPGLGDLIVSSGIC